MQAHNETMKNTPINNTNNTNNMKKLLLILTAVFVSVAGWANTTDPYRLNPYAYDLRSNYNPETKVLTYSFKVNSVPNLAILKDANGKEIWDRGIQVFVYEVENPDKRYSIWKVPDETIRAAHNNAAGSYNSSIDFDSRTDIPRDKELSWAVDVAGRNSNYTGLVSPEGIKNPQANGIQYNLPRYWNLQGGHDFGNTRYISPSIAISTNPDAPNFGHILIADGIKVTGDNTNTFGSVHGSTYTSYTQGRGIYIYEPDIKTLLTGGKKAALNATKNGGFKDPLEPRDVCVSDDGRVFVCSYSNASNAVVWELKDNYQTWDELLYTDGDRVVSMDVKGSGNDITLLLLCVGKNTNENLSCVEVSLKGDDIGTITPRTIPDVIKKGGYLDSQINVQARIAYGSNGWIWFGFGKTDGSYVYAIDAQGKLVVSERFGTYYGGEAFAVKDNLFIKSYRGNSASTYYTGIQFRTIDYTKTALDAVITNTLHYGTDGDIPDNGKWTHYLEAPNLSYNNAWFNDFVIDYANNLYVASNYHGQVFPISLPYSGLCKTKAPKGQTFLLADPIPNILATDLKYEAVPSKNQYKFSFNVNTKPSKAELRFYTSEADMLANNENVVFSYQFTDLHSGEMSVVFDAVHTTGTYEAGKTLSDTDGNGYLNLPRGEYYWNVYLEAPRNSQVFAPIYTQPTNGNRRLHATIDNNPDNDGFGHIYAVDGVDKKLMVYSIGEAQIDDNDKVNINTTNRYSSLQLLGVDLRNPRRPAVAPDGTVFLADAGTGISVAANGATGFEHAGIWVFDPSNKESEGTAQLTQFHQGSEAVSGISFYGTGDNLTLYKTNTYDEWTNHGDPEGYKDEKWQNNGYRVYDVGNPDGSVKHTLGDNVRYDGTGTLYPFGKGDARGNMSVKATSYGVWFCQHCKGKVSDTKIDGEYAVMLMCYNKQGERIFSSNIADITLEHNNQVSTSLSQDKNSIMQSAPGAGMTISPDEKYLYVVNHDGDILEFEIGGTANAKTLKHTNTFDTEYKAISSLHFDYAGNLVATAFYSTDEHPDSHYDKTPYYSDIVVYTMPNEQENKRHIPAPNSYRFVPERISQDMGIYYMSWVVDEHKKDGVSIPVADVAVYRPLKSTYFNTFCLPFEVDLSTLADNHPYKVGDGGAVLLQFAGASINSVNGEEMLELQFSPTNVMEAGKPYLFKPKNDINTIISLGKQVTFDFVDYGSDDAIASHEVGWQFGDDENKATYLALLPNGLTIDDVENSSRIYLILVDNNRLAQVFTNGSVMGLRGIFYLDHALPAGTGARIVERKSIPTGVIDTQGRPINIEKYLREGRVYIRVGDSLYTITGEKVE